MRDLYNVIEQTIALIPKDSDLIESLKDIQDSVSYAPPESMPLWWDEFSDWLNSHLPYPPCTDWQEAILDLIRDDKNKTPEKPND